MAGTRDRRRRALDRIGAKVRNASRGRCPRDVMPTGTSAGISHRKQEQTEERCRLADERAALLWSEGDRYVHQTA